MEVPQCRPSFPFGEGDVFLMTTPQTQIPLCVDLDGTLIRTDTLWESCFALLRLHFAYVFLLPFWLIRGKAFLKNEIARRVDLRVDSLPYHQELLSFLRTEHEKGRKLILATASNVKFARAIADHVGLFEKEIFSSDAKTNLKSDAKLTVLLEKYGTHGFDYAANSHADLGIWAHARHAIIVNASPRLIHRAQELATVTQVFRDRQHVALLVLKEARLYQWAKNALVFVPLIASHQIAQPSLFSATLLAFLAFGFCASSAYVLNDCLDLEADRQHPQKKKRPMASGALPISLGLVLVLGCLVAISICAVFLPLPFAFVLCLYLTLTLGYSFYLKRVVVVDVILLALLYIVRIYGGGMAINVVPSHWLLIFSLFMFLSLAIMKRFAELQCLKLTGEQEMARRGYWTTDLEHLGSVGSTSGYISVLVLALYINSNEVLPLYSRPEILWLLCPLLLYWISRAWLLAYRQRMDQDPVIFAVLDKKSYIIALLMCIILFLAK